MSQPVIQVENLSKAYRIGLKETLPDSFGAAIFGFLKNPVKNYRKYTSLYKFADSGSGHYAEVADGHMQHPGTLYFLVLKP